MTVFRWLNNNIECIEIWLLVPFADNVIPLNNNIECIEINQATANWIYDIRLNNNMECIEMIVLFSVRSNVVE